jgi:hypothetical protein
MLCRRTFQHRPSRDKTKQLYNSHRWHVKVFVLIFAFALASSSFGQSPQTDTHVKKEKVRKSKPQKGAPSDVGNGLGTAAGGAAKGAGSAATGAGKGAVDLATLHPIDAGVAAGTGAVKAGKDVTTGSVKGAGKIGKGVGHALKKIL